MLRKEQYGACTYRILRLVVFLAYSSLFKVAVMATWPQENPKCIVARNCSLELKRDTWDEYLRGRQLNKVSQGIGNENLALSRSVESQALSEISSHPSDSISSLEGDGLQVSFITHSAAAESTIRRDRSCLTIGCISILLAFILLVIGVVLVQFLKSKNDVNRKILIACELIRAAGLFGFTGGVTNWLGIKLIFKRIPGVFFSGAVVRNISVTKKLLADFIVESFFSPLQVKQYIEQKANCYLTFESFDEHLENLVNSARVKAMINEQLDFLMGTPEGLKLQFLGITKAKLEPLVKPQLLRMRVSIVPLLLSCVESLELLNADHLREQIVDLISTRTHELSAQQVEQLVIDAVYRHLSWIVFWGCVLGAVIGCLAEVASVFVRGP